MKNYRTNNVEIDSRKVKKGDVFVALKGSNVDGHEYIDKAIENGASTIILEDRNRIKDDYKNRINYVVVENSKLALYELLKREYNQPNNIIAVTGTNGKTSVVNFFVQILDKLNVDSASIGTIGIVDNKGKLADLEQIENLTTPDPITLHHLLDQIADDGIKNVALEASSHGLEQGRLGGVKIKSAAFTSFSQDHLDYHKNMDDYFKAKMILFENLLPEGEKAVLNADIREYSQICEICKKRNQQILSYGRKGDFIKINSIYYDNGLCARYEILGHKYELKTKLLGEFQLYNLFAAAGLVYSLGYDIGEITNSLNYVHSIKGRMERVGNSEVFVDYAHTPDALEKALREMKSHLEGRLIVVFGCGGDRDTTKRPLMGEIAAKTADKVIITDDNPRTEDPKKIRNDIMKAATNAVEIFPREKAIEYAIEYMNVGDRLLVAGKGHENYQIIGNVKHHFDDVEVILKKL